MAQFNLLSSGNEQEPQFTQPAPGVIGTFSGSTEPESVGPGPIVSESSSASGGGSQAGSQSQQTSVSNSYFSNPALVDSMARQFGGLYESVVPTYQNFMQDPVNSNVFQEQLKSLLFSLQPGEDDSRNQLTDRFRAAGGLRSGAHGVAGARLEGDIIGRRQNAAGTLLGQTIQQMTQLLGLPISQLAPLINALELQSSSSQGTSSSFRNEQPQTRTQSQQQQRSGRSGSSPQQMMRPPTRRNPITGEEEPNLYNENENYDWWDPWDTGGGQNLDDTTFNGGGGEGEWNYYNPTDYDYNLNTDIEVPGLGVGTGPGYNGGGGDDWNDFYNDTSYEDTGYGGDEGF